MDLFSNLALGFSVALTLPNLAYCFLGVTIGTAIGVLPGVGTTVTISALLPITFGMPPESAMIMLAGIYYGASYGGSSTAILVNLPGETNSAVTCIDGYQMARKGRAGVALAMAAIGSFIAGCIGTVLVALVATPLTEFALLFGAPEFVALILMALIAAAVLVQGSVLKGTSAALLGVVCGLVGLDHTSGVLRFTYGISSIGDGIPFVVVAVGVFGLAEVMRNLETTEKREIFAERVTGLMPTLADFKASIAPILRGTAIGGALGILPGTGQTAATFTSYAVEKRISKTPERFGHGAIEGVASPEAANNASAQTAFIPTLTLGIPGSGVMVLMLGALMIHGIVPGPNVIQSHPDLFWGLITSMWIGNIMLLILNLPLVGVWVWMLNIPYRWLYPIILVFSSIGIYTVNNNVVDVWIVIVFGALGYFFIKIDCKPVPFALGFIMGPLLEINLRRSMILSEGSFDIFVTKPISASILFVTAVFVAIMLYPTRKSRQARTIVSSE